MLSLKEASRSGRHERIRKRVKGTSERPRLYLHRSINHLQAHVVDDTTGKVLFGVSTLDKSLRSKLPSGGNVKAAALLGETLAARAKEKGVLKVAFDRGGHLYHGRVKAFAEAARKGGLEF